MNSSYKKYIITINDFTLVIISTYLAYIIRFEDLEIFFNLSLKNLFIPVILYALIFFRYSIKISYNFF